MPNSSDSDPYTEWDEESLRSSSLSPMFLPRSPSVQSPSDRWSRSPGGTLHLPEIESDPSIALYSDSDDWRHRLREPRNVQRARASVRGALRCAFAILDEARRSQKESFMAWKIESDSDWLDWDTAWERLGGYLFDLGRNVSDPRALQDGPILAGIRTLQRLYIDLVAITQDRMYARRIYRSEARAQPVFLRAWERLRAVLPPTVFLPTTLDRPSSSAGCGTGPSIRLGSSAGPSTMYISDTGSRCGPSSGSNTRSTASPLLTPAVLDQVIAHVPPVILFRITHMALAPLRPDRRKLDLSTLCSASEAVRDIDFGAAVSIFGVDKTEVTHLSLAADDLTELPDWPVFPFPNLQVLNLSNNPSLTSLPFSLTQLPRLRRLRIFMTGLRASLDMPTLASSPLPLRARPSTSTTSTIMPAGQQSRHGPGPPSLVEMVIKLLLPLLKRWRRPVRREGLVEGHTDGRADTDRKGDTDRRADLDGKGDMDGKGDTERERAGGGAQDAGEPSLTDGLPPHLVDLIDRSFNCDLCTVLVTPATLTDAGSGDRPRGPLMLCWLVQEHQQQQQQQRQQHARKRSRQTRPGKEVIIEGRLCTSCMNARVDLLHGM